MEDSGQINQLNTPKLITCDRCGKEKKHYAKGKCKSCYKYINRNVEKHKATLKRWRERNPDYWRDYIKRKRLENE